MNTFSEETFPRVNLVGCKNTRCSRSLFLTAGQLDNKHPSIWVYPVLIELDRTIVSPLRSYNANIRQRSAPGKGDAQSKR